MAQAQGSSSRTAIGIEYDPQAGHAATFWGTGVVKTSYEAFYMPFKTNSLRKSVDQVLSEQIVATRQPSSPARGNIDVAGDLTAELEGKAHGLLWFLALGNRTVTYITSPTQNYYKHQFWIGSKLPSAVVERQFTDIAQYFKYSGCIVNTLGLTLSPSGFVDYTVGFMGKTETIDTSAQIGTTNDVGGTTFDNLNTVVGEGGSFTDPGNIVEFSLEFNNNLDGSAVAIGGGGLRAGIAAGVPTVSGNLRAIFEDATLYNKAVNKTETALRFTLRNATTPTGANGSEKLVLTLPEVYLTPNAPAIEGPGGVYLDLQYAAFYSNEAITGLSTAMHVELWNQIATYTAVA